MILLMRKNNLHINILFHSVRCQEIIDRILGKIMAMAVNPALLM